LNLEVRPVQRPKTAAARARTKKTNRAMQRPFNFIQRAPSGKRLCAFSNLI
jgi:hypothetical protein